MRTRTVVYGGLIAAAYFVLTMAIAPLGYGPIQLRVSALIKPVALLNPAFALALALGTGMTDLFSPFSFWDWGFMPLVDAAAALICWRLRHSPVLAVTVQSVLISAGVSVFPLGQGAHLSPATTFIPVLIPNWVVPLIGYFLIWRRGDIRALVASGERPTIPAKLAEHA